MPYLGIFSLDPFSAQVQSLRIALFGKSCSSSRIEGKIVTPGSDRRSCWLRIHLRPMKCLRTHPCKMDLHDLHPKLDAMESKFLTVPTSWTCSLHVIDICSAKTSGRRNAMLKTCSKVTETEKLKTVPKKHQDNRPKGIEQSARKTAIQVHF